MKYLDAKKNLNRYIFEGEKQSLIEKIATNPERYIGIFRPSKPRTKLIQNLLQSHEVRFGDAIEYLMREIISSFGFSNLHRELKAKDGKTLSLDQYFTDGKHYFLMEQKASKR